MPLVKAVCTNCNANLEVDSAKDAAICPYCGTAYIVEKAINNYHIQNHMYIPNPADTMYEKAMSLVRLGEKEKAQQTLERMMEDFPGDGRAPRYLALQWLERCCTAQETLPDGGLAWQRASIFYPQEMQQKAQETAKRICDDIRTGRRHIWIGENSPFCQYDCVKVLFAEAKANAQQYNGMTDSLLRSLGYPRCVERLRMAERLYSSYKDLYCQTVGAHLGKLLFGDSAKGALSAEYIIGTVFANKYAFYTHKMRYPFAPSLLDWLYREASIAMQNKRCPHCGGKGTWDRRTPVGLPQCKDCRRRFYSL